MGTQRIGARRFTLVTRGQDAFFEAYSFGEQQLVDLMSCNACPVRVGAWSAWLPWDDGYAIIDAQSRVAAAVPDIGFLPLNQRKRLNLLSKIGLCLADRAVSQSPHSSAFLTSVFATRYGECQRTYSMLESITGGVPPSPAAFSSSVHNTTSGLWSIATQCLAPSTTVTAGDATLYAGLLEAADVGAETREPILFVYADVPLPDRYSAYDRSGGAAGFAAVIEPERSEDAVSTLDLAYAPNDDGPRTSTVQQVRGLVELLDRTVTEFRASTGLITWNLGSG